MLLNYRNDMIFDSAPNSLGLEIEDLDQESLNAFLDLVKSTGRVPSTSSLDAKTILMRIGAYAKNVSKEGYCLNNGAILFLGKSVDILSLKPHFWLDYVYHSGQSERFYDRVTSKDLICEGNIFQFYSRSLEKAFAFSPSPFYVEGDKNVGKAIFGKILREAFANAISNLDLFDSRGLRIENSGASITFSNAGTMLVPLERALLGGVSKPRNPAIFSLFQALGVSDRGGYGIPFIFDSAKKLSLIPPALLESKEENVTTLRIFFRRKESKRTKEEETVISLLMGKKSFMSILDISSETGISRDKTRKAVESLVAEGLLEDNGKITKGKAFRYVWK